MDLDAAILRQRIGEFECVELDIGVSVSKAFDHCGYGIFPSSFAGIDSVAYVEDVLPVLRSEVLVGRFR